MLTPCKDNTITKEATKTFTISETSKTRNCKDNLQTTENSDFTNTCISLTKEFEAMSSPDKASIPMHQNCRGQKAVTPGITTGAQPNKNSGTPLRVPSSFTVSNDSVFQTVNSLNESSKCTSRKATPHPKVCWTNKPVEPECTSPEKALNRFGSGTPVRESVNELNLSGIQPLRETPADKDQQNMSAGQVCQAAFCYFRE